MDASPILFLRSAIVDLIPVALVVPAILVYLVYGFIAKQKIATSESEDRSSDLINHERPIDLLQVPDLPLISEQVVAKHHPDLYLPFDIVIDILSRLPVKTLFRLKSVCKQWNDLIPNSPHLRNHANRRPSSIFFCCKAFRNSVKAPLFLLSSPDQPPIRLDDNHLANLAVCSSGDVGLLLLRHSDSYTSDFSLWNPATGQIKHLPKPPVGPPVTVDPWVLADFHLSCELYGVGLDLVANEIKVVIVRHYCGNGEHKFPVYVYTLGGDWRELDGGYPLLVDADDFPLEPRSSCTYYKGSFYWVCGKYTTEYVAVFDFRTEVFHNFELPNELPDGAVNLDDCFCKVFVYCDSIALFRGDKRRSSSVDIWLLSRSSSNGLDNWRWIKHSSFCPFPEKMTLWALWEEDDLVFVAESENNSLVWFDAGKQQVKAMMPDCLVTQQWRDYKLAMAYKENLVSID